MSVPTTAFVCPAPLTCVMALPAIVIPDTVPAEVVFHATPTQITLVESGVPILTLANEATCADIVVVEGGVVLLVYMIENASLPGSVIVNDVPQLAVALRLSVTTS